MTFRDFFHKEKLRDWFVTHADSPKAGIALGVISFLEAIFFPIPPDFILIAILASNKAKRWAYYSLITSVFSVLGGMVSYFIGYLFFDTLGAKIIELYNFQEWFEKTKLVFEQNAFWSVLVAAITPIPDKLFNLLAGLFKINPFIFLLAYVVARSTRFFIVGLVMKIFGVRISKIIYRHLSIFLALTLVLIVCAILVIVIK
jgi:membrane protein YqaA with SNARE-associated domain